MSYSSQIRSLPPEPSAQPLRRRGTAPVPELEEEEPKPAPRMPQPAQALPGGVAQPASAPFRPPPPQAAPEYMVKYHTTPEEKQRARDWMAGKEPQNTTAQVLPHRQDRSSPVNDSAVPLMGQTPKPAGSLPPGDMVQRGIPQTTSQYEPRAARQVMRPGSLSPEPQPAAVSQQPPAAGQQPAAASQPSAQPPIPAPQGQQPQPRGLSPNPRAANMPGSRPQAPVVPAQAAPPNRADQAEAVRQAGAQRAAAARLQAAKNAGAVIEDGQTVPHPDGQGGLLHHSGFVLTTDPNDPAKAPTVPFRNDPAKGPAIPYRDDHGRQHAIPVQDMRRVSDPDGINYHFDVDGKPVSVPEGSTPPFQVDAKGRRFTQAADGTRRELGADPNAAAQAAIEPQEQAAAEARDTKLAQAAAAQQRFTTAKQKVDAINAANSSYGPGAQVRPTSEQQTAARQELIESMSANESQARELEALQKQHDDHFRSLVDNNRARNAVSGQLKSAAAASPTDTQAQKDARAMHGDPRASDLGLIAAAEKAGPGVADAVRKAAMPAPTRRLLDAAEKSFGSGTGGQPGGPVAGKSMSLHEMLMQAPEMKQGGWKAVDQAAAARSTAQSAFGITDPENVHVTPNASGGYSLSRKTDGGGAGQPFATMDGETGHITLLPGADGKYSQAAQDFAAKSTPGSAPIYLGKGTPLTEAERSALIAKGQQATSAAKDRQGADAALTEAGLSPEGIQKMRNEGRLSVQDAKFLNDKFNSGAGSYAQRDALETAQKQNAGLQQMYQDTQAPADKPNFKSWMEKGDPQRDAQVQAKAKELGLSEDDVRKAMEDQRRMDFATPLTQEGHDQQSGFVNGLKRGVGMSGHDQDTTRTLTDGSLAVNPALTDDKAKFEKAIQDSNASPEAKAAALKSWSAQHDAWLTQATDTLKASKTIPGIQDYTEWLTSNQLAGHFSEKRPDGTVRPYTDNEKTQLYIDAMKARPGWRKVADNISTSLVSGGGQVVSGVLGAAALAGNTFEDITGVNVGGQAVSEAAAGMAQQNQALTQSHELTGTVEGKGGRFLSNLIQAVPSVVAAVATGGTAGLILGAAQSAGSTYTDLLQHHIMAGDSIEEAHKKAAGTAIASGAVGLVLSKVMPGGSQALNNPATREAARKTFGAALKSAIKGGAEEFSQEAIDGGFNYIASEMNKGKSFNEAATSYAERYPQNALTSALLGGGVQAMADKKNSSAPQQQQPALPQQAPPPGHVAPSGQPNGKQSFSTVDAEGREIPSSDTLAPATIAPVEIPRQPATAEPASGPSIPPSTTQSGTASDKEAKTAAPDNQPPQKPGSDPSSPDGKTDNTTASTAGAPPGMVPSKEAAAAGKVMTLENAPQVLGDIERLKAKEQNGSLSKDEQIDLHHAENLLARAQVTNLEAKQKALSQLPTPRDLHSTELEALAKARAMLARPWPGTAPATTTQSSSGSLPPGDTSTAHGVTPPTGIATSSHAGTGDTGSPTSTASSGDSSAPGSATHTTNGVTAPEIGHGNLIPETTTHREHIDLATRRAENLEEIARKRKLDPHQQEIYDNARRVRDRNAPAQPGDRNTSNPKDLVLAGDGPISQTHGAAAKVPPTAPAQAADAIGARIEGHGTTNPDAPTASANDGSGNSGTPAAPQQHQPLAPQGASPTNDVANGSGQPPLVTPASTQGSGSMSLPQSATRPQGPQLPFASSPNLEWHVPHDPARHLLPDKPFDATRKPTKPPKVLSKNDTNPHNKRGVDGENETAHVLAQNGYEYEQVAQNKEKLPDGTIVGAADGVFGKAPNSKSDVFSPQKSKNIKGIHDVVSDKVASQNSPYVTVRLESGGQDIKELAKYFRDHPVPDLKQLFVIKDGKLHIIY